MAVSFSFSVASSSSTLGADASTAQIAAATALRDLELDPLTGDLSRSAGDLVFNYGIAGIASDLASRWRTFKGEWFLDLNMGVDYFGVVFVGRPDLGAIEEEFRREALACPGVSGVTLTLSLVARVLSVAAQITTDTGLIFGVTFAADSGG